jgi:hypothetical protein
MFAKGSIETCEGWLKFFGKSMNLCHSGESKQTLFRCFLDKRIFILKFTDETLEQLSELSGIPVETFRICDDDRLKRIDSLLP